MLGRQGRRYLGVDMCSDRLNPDERRISAIHRQETYADDFYEDLSVPVSLTEHGDGGLSNEQEFDGPPRDSIPPESILDTPDDFQIGIPPIDDLPGVSPYRTKTPI
jgi:hypothetical protein